MFPIEIARLAGSGQILVNIFDDTATDRQIDSMATAVYQLLSSGTGQSSRNTGVPSTWTWLLVGVNSDYQVRATLVSGPSPTGDALGSWLSLNSSRAWQIANANPGTVVTSVITVEIRKVANSQIVDTATITIKATCVDSLGGGGGSL